MRTNICLSVIVCLSLLAGLPAEASDTVISDFEDSTLQGWMPEPPFDGTLTVQSTGGNPGGFMQATDTASGGSLFVRAPSPLAGDLSGFAELRWDQFVFLNPSADLPTFVRVVGPDGTTYETDRELSSEEVGVWTTKSVSLLDSDDWTLHSGTASFQAVLSDASLFISMDTSTGGVFESGIDNVVVRSLTNDEDSDGIPDISDNCTSTANVDQRDTDGDGIGNSCDADLNNDCAVNFEDLSLMKAVFFGADEDADLDGDGAVNFTDLGIMKSGFFNPPGPSCLPNNC